MNSSTPAHPLIYYRLIALWILCEAMLGGIIFSLRIPVSGLVIGSCAVICISLIAWYVPVKGAVIRATLLVAIFKMMLSPQAPPAAYFAVFFQGLMGEFLFWNRRYHRLSCLLLAILALLESAFQRILTLTIIYGNDLWTAVNSFIRKLAGGSEVTDYSYFIIFWYVAAHLVMGVLVGIWAGYLPGRISLLRGFREQFTVQPADTELTVPVKRKHKTRRYLLLGVWIVLTGLYLQSFFHIGDPLLPASAALRILTRSVIIILTWYFFISPALKQLLNRWLLRKKQESVRQVQEILNLLPSTQGLVSRSWQLSGIRRGWRRIWLCGKIILANTFYPNEN